ncbi:MAG: AMP-binding protein, partial [Cyanobacteriota bacterium]
HLEASAAATAAWLRAQGIDPARCLHLNPLPLHHVSGLMPLVRSRCWGAALRRLSPELLRQPADLPGACPLPEDSPVLLSLVPTQLRRLMASAAATDWLRRCAVIWVGGAALPAELAREARRQRLPLAPCYGATETAAMVCALPPARFLAGEE